VDAELEAALAPIKRDLKVPSGVILTVVDQRWQEDAETASAFLYGPDGSGMGIWIQLGLPLTTQIVTLAEQVQEWAVEALWHLGRSASWPECPYHPARRPLEAREVEGGAVWACPVLNVFVSQIGQLTDLADEDGGPPGR
jgi:hypothetical protein